MKKSTISNNWPGNAMSALAGLILVAATSAQAQTLNTSGDINTPGNWDTGALPVLGETGTVDIDSNWPTTSAFGTVVITGDLVFGGGSTLTAVIDVVGSNPNSVTFNDVTVNVGDDIFPGGSGANFIFNAGSITNVDDDFEANGGGTITVNGGMHTVGVAPTGTANFGAQNGSTLNFLGGTVGGVGLFRSTATGTINIGGSASLTADAASLAGDLDIASDWTGTLAIPGVDWETILTSGATFDGALIDAAIFADNFVVGGNTLSLVVVGVPLDLIATNPNNGDVNAPTTGNLVASFSEPIALGASGDVTISNLTNPGDIVISLPGPDSDGVLSVSNNALIIDPAFDLVAGDQYAVQIGAAVVEDLDGSNFAGISDLTTWAFTTDGVPPTTSSTGPMAGDIEVEVDASLTFTFDEDVQVGTGFVTIHLVSDDSVVEAIDVISGNVTINGTQISISPTSELSNGTEFYVTVTPGAFTDLSGNPYVGISDPTAWIFTTVEFDATILFADNFDRPDATVTGDGTSADGDINGTNSGKSGTLGDLMWAGRAFNSNTFGVVGNALTQVSSLAGANGGLAYINDHNFTDSVISTGGGFSITIDIVSYATGGSGRWWTIGVGQSLAELDALTENNNQDALALSSADLLVAYRNTTGDLEIYNNGVLNTVETVTTGLPAPPTTIRVDYALSDFNQGSIVTYEVFFDSDETPFTTGSFTWSETEENYISLGNNLSGNSQLDNFVVRANVAVPLQLGIVQNGGTLDFDWNSTSGRQYDLVSNTDLVTQPSTWLPYNDGVMTYENILSAGTGTQALSGVLLVGPRRFFALVEEPVAPLFSEDFESSDGGFTSVTTAGTDWAHGDPDSMGPGGEVTTGNEGSVNCWGTDIGNPGFYLNPTTDACLRSSVIDLTGVAGAQLTFAQAIDLDEDDSVTVNIIDDVTDTVIATDIVSIIDGDIESAPWQLVGPVAIPNVALGQLVRIEWCLSGTGGTTNDFMGWYIDDVTVTPTTP